MAKAKTKQDDEQDGGILDYLGMSPIGGEDGAGDKPKPSGDSDRVDALLKTIDTMGTRMDEMQNTMMQTMANRAPAPITAIAPTAPTLTPVTLDGLPDAAVDPDGFAKGLNDRLTRSIQDNVTALTNFSAAQAANASAATGRSDALWADFQTTHYPALGKDLPDAVDLDTFVEVAARKVAGKAQRRGVNLETYMYASDAFLNDVAKEAELVLAPLRIEPEGDTNTPATEPGPNGPTPKEVEAHRTGIISDTGKSAPPTGEDEGKGSLVTDLQDIQRSTGFF